MEERRERVAVEGRPAANERSKGGSRPMLGCSFLLGSVRDAIQFSPGVTGSIQDCVQAAVLLSLATQVALALRLGK